MKSLSDRLNHARQSRFVGRQAELELFRGALHAEEPAFQLLYIHGPGGIGKTTLLREFVRICETSDIGSVYLDTQGVEPAPEPFLRALATALQVAGAEDAAAALAQSPGPRVLVLDTCEHLAPLDAWLRESFLPKLGADSLVVMASRQPPQPVWRSDPGWSALLRLVSLRNLTPDESRAYLARREIPGEEHEAFLQFTHGHPLALSLVAEVFHQPGMRPFQPDEAPDLIRSLLERFVQHVPGPRHRAALEACALVRITTETILSELLASDDTTADGRPDARPDAPEVFDWLRGLSFMDSGPLGVYPHELAREAIATDLRWRNKERYADLHRRARVYYKRRVQETHGIEQQLVLWEYIFLHRDNPIVRPFFDWEAAGDLATEPARPADLPAILELTRTHEGDESAEWVRFWFERQPERFVVVRDARKDLRGYLSMLSLGAARPEDLQKDPATRIALEYLKKHAPLRDGDAVTYFRHWMARDTYQEVSPAQSLLIVRIVQHFFAEAGLAFSFVAVAQPLFWTLPFAYADLQRMSDAEFADGGREYGVFGHDWRKVSPLPWLDVLAERELGGFLFPQSAPEPVETLHVLSREEFDQAVKDAVKNWLQPDALRQSPLLRTRLVGGAGADDPASKARVETLKARIKAVTEQMKSNPRDLRFLRAVHYTYLQPLDTQELAASRIGVPFSTYRRHLASGLGRIAELLWQREVGEV